MSYMKRTAAVEAFLTGRRIPDEDVLSLDVARSPVRLHLYGALLSGVTWRESGRTPGNVHHLATVVQDGVEIELITVLIDEEVAA